MAHRVPYDLIIVGGGPGGATAALYARRLGLDALLLDQAHFPRDKICGDAVGGKAIAVLRDLGLEDEMPKLPGVRFRKVVLGSSKRTRAVIDLEHSTRAHMALGFVVRRTVFDDFLFAKARAAGAECIEGFRVDDLVFDDGRVAGVTGTDTGTGEQRTYHGRAVIGADGYKSIVARKLGLYHIDPDHWIVAIRQYFRNVTDMSDRLELHFESMLSPGYLWIFPLDNGVANVGLGMVDSAMRRKHVKLPAALASLTADPAYADRFADAEPLEKPVGWHLPVGSQHRKCHGAGFLLIGDAAGLIDPSIGEGIANAMYSARVAAETVATALRENDVSERSLARYDKALWDVIGPDLAFSTRLQKILKNRPLFDFLIRKAAYHQDVADTLAAIIAEEIPRTVMLSPMFFLKLALKRDPRR